MTVEIDAQSISMKVIWPSWDPTSNLQSDVKKKKCNDSELHFAAERLTKMTLRWAVNEKQILGRQLMRITFNNLKYYYAYQEISLQQIVDIL